VKICNTGIQTSSLFLFCVRILHVWFLSYGYNTSYLEKDKGRYFAYQAVCWQKRLINALTNYTPQRNTTTLLFVITQKIKMNKMWMNFQLTRYWYWVCLCMHLTTILVWVEL
jgi:hypothetical protein